jgi:hypothetical protein
VTPERFNAVIRGALHLFAAQARDRSNFAALDLDRVYFSETAAAAYLRDAADAESILAEMEACERPERAWTDLREAAA